MIILLIKWAQKSQVDDLIDRANASQALKIFLMKKSQKNINDFNDEEDLDHMLMILLHDKVNADNRLMIL